jgi:hypothetical protein
VSGCTSATVDSLASGGRGEAWHDADALHDPEHVDLAPVLDEHSVLEAADVHLGPLERPSGRRYPHHLAEMRASADDAMHHLGAFADQVLDRERCHRVLEVGDGPAPHLHEPDEALAVRGIARRQWDVLDEIGEHDVIRGRDVSRVVDQLRDTAEARLVVGHRARSNHLLGGIHLDSYR